MAGEITPEAGCKPVIDLTQSRSNWSLEVKIRRGIWTFLLEPLGRRLPRFCSPVRIALLRLLGARIGKGCMILPGVKVLMPWNLDIGDHAAIGRDVEIYNFAPVRIGGMSVVSQRGYLCTGSHDYTHAHMPLTYAPITIGSECWLAAGVFVSPGVNVPDGCVVGAMSVVTGSLPEAWSVYAGNPCRRLKQRRIVGGL